MNEQDLDVYSYASPVHCQDIGICYYCGCESEFEDYAPPRDDSPFYLKSGESCSFAIIATCNECFGFLKTCREGLIEDRKIFINKRIEKKYRKALRIYEKWSLDELMDMDASLVSSIKAGISLGEEAYDRLRFLGFEYEIDGNVFHTRRRNVKEFSVFGEKFDNFRNALQYAARSSKININTLKELVMDNNAEFDVAIDAYFDEKDKALLEKEKKRLCVAFAKEHKQNSNFVKGALEAYMTANPELAMEECLDLIYVERVINNTCC